MFCPIKDVRHRSHLVTLDVLSQNVKVVDPDNVYRSRIEKFVYFIMACKNRSNNGAYLKTN